MNIAWQIAELELFVYEILELVFRIFFAHHQICHNIFVVMWHTIFVMMIQYVLCSFLTIIIMILSVVCSTHNDDTVCVIQFPNPYSNDTLCDIQFLIT